MPSKTATVLGTAAQGTVLTVLSHSDADGGWFEVKGATVTGWMSADPALSSAGEYRSFTSTEFNAMYPAAWSASGFPPANVTFKSGAGPEQIVAVAAAAPAQLPPAPQGYGKNGSTQVVVCGITSDLITYQQVQSTTSSTNGSSPMYLATVALSLDAQHALGFYAIVSDTSTQLPIFRAFLASVTYPVKQCIG
jgi:hypothetical protein